jgi:hypothetical protein
MGGGRRPHNSLAGKWTLRLRIGVPRTGETVRAGLFCVGLLALTLAPVAQNWARDPRDDFPFSYYPMFSRPLGATYEVTHVLGIDRDGHEHVVPFGYLGHGGFNQVRVHVSRAARDDARRFCERVAAAVRAEPSAELRDVQTIAVRSGRYALRAFYEGRLEPRLAWEHARCLVR